MQSKYFFMGFLAFTGNVYAQDIHDLITSYCNQKPELHEQVLNIIDDTTLSAEEKLPRLLTLQNNAYIDTRDKIMECVDIYTDTALKLQKQSKGFMVMNQLKDVPPMSLTEGADVFKRRLLNSVDKLFASANIALVFALAACEDKIEQPEIFAFKQPSTKHILSFFSQKNVLGTLTTIGSLCTYGYAYAQIYRLKHQVLTATPLSEWIDASGNYTLQRHTVLVKIAEQFPHAAEYPQIYETIGEMDIHSTSIEAFLIAAEEEERILRNYLWWEKWASRCCMRWLLPFSAAVTETVKAKLQNIIRMHEII